MIVYTTHDQTDGLFQASSLPLSIIIVGVGDADFEGQCCQQVVSFVFVLIYELFERCFTSTETVGLLGTGAKDVHLDLHTAPELWFMSQRVT